MLKITKEILDKELSPEALMTRVKPCGILYELIPDGMTVKCSLVCLNEFVVTGSVTMSPMGASLEERTRMAEIKAFGIALNMLKAHVEFMLFDKYNLGETQ